MKILILGNIGAGKTTVAKQLQQNLGYELCLIDDFRMKYGDGTVPGEYLALYHFLRECSKHQDAILEFTGAGCHKYAVKKAIEDAETNVVVVLLHVPIEHCKRRISDREWDIPIPSWDFKLDHHLGFIDDDLKADYQEKFWAKPSNFSVIKCDNLNEEDLDMINKELDVKIRKMGE